MVDEAYMEFIKAKLQNLQKTLEDKADMYIDKDWNKATNLLSFATACNGALELLKEREGYVSVPFSWLVKFCTHIDFVEPLTDAEREVAWRQKLRQQFGINVP